jgi:hypothetical protein
VERLLEGYCAPFLNKNICEGMVGSFLAAALTFVLFSVILFGLWKLFRKQWVKRRWIYISIPMSQLDDNKFQQKKTFITSIESILSKNYTVFHGFQAVNRKEDYNNEERTLVDIIKKIKKSNYTIFIIDQRSFTSSLVELGIAIASKRNIIICYRKDNRGPMIPFLLYSLQNESIRGLKLRKCEFDSYDKLLAAIGEDGSAWLLNRPQ